MTNDSTNTLPKLPPFIANGNTRYGYYLCVYKNRWDKEKKRSVRVSATSVGRIEGNSKYGLVRFYDDFLEKYPRLREYHVYRSPGPQRYVLIPKPVDEVERREEDSSIEQLSARAERLLKK